MVLERSTVNSKVLNFDVRLVLVVSIDLIISDDSCCKRRFAILKTIV